MHEDPFYRAMMQIVVGTLIAIGLVTTFVMLTRC
jgi:hypothetical protein